MNINYIRDHSHYGNTNIVPSNYNVNICILAVRFRDGNPMYNNVNNALEQCRHFHFRFVTKFLFRSVNVVTSKIFHVAPVCHIKNKNKRRV